MIRVGPAGWSYRDWEGVVYPRPRPRGFDPLEYLAGYFDTIEINSTFYRPAAPGAAESWVERLRGNRSFRFAVKLWRRFTHERDEAFTAADVKAVRSALDPLDDGGRLGAVLLQFPWSFRRDDDGRLWLDDVTRAFRAFPLVLEVRHDSWNVPAFYEELSERGVGFVNIDQPRFKRSIGPSAAATSGVGYVRIHGRNYADWFRKDARPEQRYDYLYTAEELEPWVDRIHAVADATDEVYVITNNHYRGKGIANAVMLQAQLAGTPMPAPPGVIAQYSETMAGHVEPTLEEAGTGRGRTGRSDAQPGRARPAARRPA
ncbi:MAG TPA: DUF72 domain-containing protein [Gemmatimonadales bacterium]|nr:DUF72 domain-containing protein [Gemmatimonadales bacterium]